MKQLHFITASHDPAVLAKNLLASPIFKRKRWRWRPAASAVVQRGYTNIPQAYNAANTNGAGLVAYVHHDVFLPPSFEAELRGSLEAINRMDPQWGVLGVAGVRLENGAGVHYGNLRDRGNEWGQRLTQPVRVDTLDELLLIPNGRLGLRFEESLPLHFYGADLCMQARLAGHRCYAVQGYCHHNSSFDDRFPESFFECQRRFCAKYAGQLPIATTCAICK
jgi:hypothetical protein